MDPPTLIDALDLESGSPSVGTEEVALDAHAVQQRATEFRKDYRNWRVQGAHMEEKVQPLPVSADAPREVAKAIADHIVVAKGIHLASGARTGSDGQVTPEAHSSAQSPESTVAHSTLQGSDNSPSTSGSEATKKSDEPSSVALAQDEHLHPERWTKFYMTPFGAPLSVTRRLAPVCGRLLEEELEPRERLTLPAYQRSIVNSYMVHLGVGGFHRSHQAYYTHQLLQHYQRHPEEKPKDVYGICGMGLRPRMSETDLGDEGMCEVLQKQDFLYTLVLRSEAGTDAHVIGSMTDLMLAPRDYHGAIERLASPDTRILSLTITEKGYCQDVGGGLDWNHPGVAHDFMDCSTPKTMYGLVTASLRLRKERGLPSYTILSCDNMPENGDTAKRILLQFVERCDPGLHVWIDQNTPFPNTMVDRITPVTEEQHKVLLHDEFSLDDEWPVFAEHFCQWVVEDHFACGRPEWEKVGVLFVRDVKPYEYMKLRLLNGGHSALAYLSYLAGHVNVDVAMADPAVRGFVRGYLHSVKRCLSPLPGMDMEEYIETLIRRFSNPYIKDKVARLAEDGSKKLYATMRAPILELSAAGRPTCWLALAVAGFLQFMSGCDLAGQPVLCIRDPAAAALAPLCLESCTSGDVRPPLDLVFGREVADLAAFVEEVRVALHAVRTEGVVPMLLRHGPIA